MIRPNEMMSHNSLDFARFMIQVIFFNTFIYSFI